MIVGWKSVNMDEFQATWQGMLLTLAKAACKWRLWIYAQSDGDTLVVNNLPGAAVKGAWTEPRAAMEAVDTAMNRVLKKKMSTVSLARPGTGIVSWPDGTFTHHSAAKPLFTREVHHA